MPTGSYISSYKSRLVESTIPAQEISLMSNARMGTDGTQHDNWEILTATPCSCDAHDARHEPLVGQRPGKRCWLLVGQGKR